VRGDRIVQLDRRTRALRNEAGVQHKFGVLPPSIPDWLALVGDSADGYPGLPGWGAASAASVLARYLHLDEIPPQAKDWEIAVRGAPRLAATLVEQRERALLFRQLARLRPDAPIDAGVDALRWSGPRAVFATWAERLGAPQLYERATTLAAARCGSPNGLRVPRALTILRPSGVRVGSGRAACHAVDASALSCRHTGHRAMTSPEGGGTP
jgi:5'-3' exonuclease